MSEASVAIITAVLTVISSVGSAAIVSVTNRNKTIDAVKRASEKSDAEFDKRISVYAAHTDEKIDELTREVREHNNFARRVPLVEQQVNAIDKRLERIENSHG